MNAPPLHRLAVDLGTSTTIAMLQWPDGRVRPLLFDGTPLLSSAVLLGPDGRLQTGRDAAHLSRRSPERLEPNPKRRVDDDVVLLGEAVVPVRDLLAATEWNKEPPPPPISDEVVTETRTRYIEAYEMITGLKFNDWYGA